MKKAIIYGILVCLLTPSLTKTFFHSHEHQGIHTSNSWDYSFSADDVDCFVCDIDLSNITFSTLHTFNFDPKAIVHGKELAYFHEALDYFDHNQHRGPPAIV